MPTLSNKTEIYLMSPSEIKNCHADSFVEEVVSWKKDLNLTVTTIEVVIFFPAHVIINIIGGGPFVAGCRLDKLIRC